MRRALWLAMMLVLAAAAPARAEGGQYEAKWLSQSDYLTLESGQTATSYFVAENIGSATWTNDVVRLGTSNPRDRASAFANSSWINTARATPLDQDSVEPGGTGRFTFTVTAPPVASTTVYDEYFAPLAEGRAWMENDSSGWTPSGVFLRYTVLAPEPPSVAIASAPSHVPAGTPVAVHARASDNGGVDRVEFQIAGRPPVVDANEPYDAALDTTGLPSGPQPVHVTAVDQTGRTASADTTVNLDPVPNGAGASRGARMTASFTRRRHQPRKTVPYGRAAYVRGRLVDEAGRPITGAVIRVATRVLTGRTGFREVKPVSTGADGGYAFRAAPGPSRQIRLTYTPFAEDTQPATLKLVRLATRAGVTLHAQHHRVPPGGRAAFRGRLRGGYEPRRGVLVVLQGYQRRFGWRTFKTVRARAGRFHGSYRFLNAGRATFGFRAVVRAQDGYPWATGRSRRAVVRVG